MTVPNITKDFVEVIETRLPGGKWIAKFLIGLVVLVLIGGLLYLVFNAGRAVLSKLPTSIPVHVEPKDWISLAIVVLLFAAFFWLTQRRLTKLENVKPVDQDVRDAMKELDDAMIGMHDVQGQVQKTVENLGTRLKYIEKKLGDELTDTLTKTLIAEADRRYYQKPQEPEAPPQPNPKVELGRKLLREAAQELRYAFKDPVSWDTKETASRGWLALQVSKLATEILSPDALQDLETFKSAREAKRKLREQGSDAKDHAINLVEYLENLAENLAEDELDQDVDLPASFEQFRKAHGG
jgi:hypothetical protein